MFQALLQSGLWNTQPDLNLFFGKPIPWQEIISMADKQAVTAIVFDGMLRLPAELHPPRPLFLAWFARIAMVEQANTGLNRRLASLLAESASQGLHPVLLKGQGIASLYHNPLHRMCGDIDLLALDGEFSSFNAFLKKIAVYHPQNIVEQTGILGRFSRPVLDRFFSDESNHHTEFRYGEASVELHKFMTRMYFPLFNRRWQHIMSAELSRPLPSVKIDGCDVTVLNPTFNALYLFMHKFRHFVCVDGIGMRQFCDWAVLFDREYQNMDLPRLRSYLKSLHLEKAFRAFGYIAVSYIGLSPDKFPYPLSADDKRWGELIFLDILKGGNFGHSNIDLHRRPQGRLAGKLHWYSAHFRRARRFGGICPWEFSYYFYWRILDALFCLRRDPD